jgi:outer membrane protein TolC
MGILPIACGFLLSLLSIEPAQAAAPLTLGRAIDRAVARNPAVAEAGANQDQATARRKAARGNLGPSITLGASVYLWNDDVAFAMGEPDAAVMQEHAEVFQKYSDLFVALPALFDFGPVREQVTSQVSVTVAQPLSPLYQTIKGYKAARRSERGAEKALQRTREATAFRAAQAYLGVKQAESAVAITRSAIDQIEAQLAQARAFLRAGTIGRVDLLNVEVALAEAEQREIGARAAASLARTRLAVVMGATSDTGYALVDDFPVSLPPAAGSFQQALERALSRRADLAAARLQARATEDRRDMARWDLVPRLSAVARYENAQGMGFATPENTFFVGASLEWPLWQWGSSYYGYRAASAQVEAGAAKLRALEDRILLEVKEAHLGVRTARKAVEVSRLAVERAEERYRIQKAKFAENASTSRDVLADQLALTRARLSAASNAYAWYMARATLLLATGTKIVNADTLRSAR